MRSSTKASRATGCMSSPTARSSSGARRRMGGRTSSPFSGRAAKALIDLSTRFGVPSEEGIHVTHDLTQEELAQLVGASRETVNKALADFASRGWLRLEGKGVVILDKERLARRARV